LIFPRLDPKPEQTISTQDGFTSGGVDAEELMSLESEKAATSNEVSAFEQARTETPGALVSYRVSDA
jgi:hypothetical protein